MRRATCLCAGKTERAEGTGCKDLHLWVKQLLQEGKPAEEIVLQYYKEHPDCIFICDEIGNGIVPMEKQEREYRERVGRLLIRLAGEAETVERIICGMGQKIK